MTKPSSPHSWPRNSRVPTLVLFSFFLSFLQTSEKGGLCFCFLAFFFPPSFFPSFFYIAICPTILSQPCSFSCVCLRIVSLCPSIFFFHAFSRTRARRCGRRRSCVRCSERGLLLRLRSVVESAAKRRLGLHKHRVAHGPQRAHAHHARLLPAAAAARGSGERDAQQDARVFDSRFPARRRLVEVVAAGSCVCGCVYVCGALRRRCRCHTICPDRLVVFVDKYANEEAFLWSGSRAFFLFFGSLSFLTSACVLICIFCFPSNKSINHLINQSITRSILLRAGDARSLRQ